MDMSKAITEVARNLKGGPTTPERRNKAIDLVLEDDEFSENEQGEIMVLFAEDVGFADTYVAIPRKSLRTSFIQSKLAKSRNL
jgi:hypothetical protein